MDALLLIGLLLLASIGGFLLCSLLLPRPVQPMQTLVPFSVLPVHDALPATEAYLELLAGQIAWMDSAVMQSMVLVFQDDDTETAELCRKIAQQYDFFTCMTLTQAKELLEARMEEC